MKSKESENLGLMVVDAVTLDNIADLSSTIIDASLTSLLEGGILEDIPVVGSFFKLLKVGTTIRE